MLQGTAGGASRHCRRCFKASPDALSLRDTAERLALLAPVLADVVEAGNVTEMRTEVAEEFSVEATVVPPAPQD